MSEKSIKPGEEIVNEFFERLRDENGLDEKTRDALYKLYKQGIFRKTQVKKALDEIRGEALGEEDAD
ncbi:MAG: hypothetical protein HWN69_00960 [Desulfobacterales bacterium]|nr:hypothetical protein [Desulfobacterales bacterium]